MDTSYLSVGKATDLKNKKDKALFRLFEIMPGVLSFGTLFLLIALSYFQPVWVSYFIIIFAIYWLVRTVYFSFYLSATYKKMRQSEKANWIEKLNGLKLQDNKLEIENWNEIYHLIVWPMYKEPVEIVRDSLQSLLKNDYPKDKMIVVLACEEKARKDVEVTAQIIEKEFGDKFFKFLATWHPDNIPNEILGKGSNETWSVKRTKDLLIDPLEIPYKNIVFSSFDIDTVVPQSYFSCLTYYYLTVKNPTQTSFQPVPLFLNNIWQAPLLSRIFSFSTTFWQMMCQERPEKLITFSSHSMSFNALVDIGFKQTNVVSDDSRVFWQCFFRYKGNYSVQPMYYPISMDANVADNSWKTLINIYKQQRRWAYGVGETPYFILAAIKDKEIPFGRKFSLGFMMLEGHWSWATNSVILFLFGWLPLVLGGVKFSQTLVSYNLPLITSRIMTVAMIGIVASIYFSIALLPKPEKNAKRKYFSLIVGWIITPIILVLFTAIPALDAQLRWMIGKYMGFWPTEKIRK